ncbi:MAG: ATP-binding cassette domain-containing protein, partial [Actinomycetota bacterium]|nr:ATP-binding cassette domain-containing protein [Actinomycetota bacterium]
RTRARVDELLDLVGMDPAEFRGRYPHQLSGGQRQRVGVARALAVDPPVLLMDEPFGAIDPITRLRLQQEFRRLQGEVRKTVVFVTHDVDEAVLLGDRIAILREGGVLEQVGSPSEVLAAPASPFVADFVGADRGLKRLAVTGIDPTKLERPPQQNAESLPEVPATSTLKDALSQLLLSDRGMVAVRDGEQLRGVLTAEALYQAARPAGEEDDGERS